MPRSRRIFSVMPAAHILSQIKRSISTMGDTNNAFSGAANASRAKYAPILVARTFVARQCALA